MKNMDNLIRTYRQYKRIADEAKAELDKLKPQIIAELGGDNTINRRRLQGYVSRRALGSD